MAGEVQAFAALLRRHRVAAGLSQEGLAERAGLSVRGISDLERGVRRSPHPSTIARLADALGLDALARASLVRAGAASEPQGDGEAPTSAPRGLPLPLTSFVARDEELREVTRLLSSARLLTLVGPGGIGKTRLAIEAARGKSESPVTFVELAPLLDGASVPEAVAAALGLADQSGGRLLEAIVGAIGTRPLLLVLDNCEHVVGSAAELSERLLSACVDLRILATSREPLGLTGEVLWRVPSLELPGGRAADGLDSLLEIGSVRLFVERTRAARPGFELSEANASAVLELCRRLDGIPLALELAAARARALPVEQLVALLDDRFRLLVGGSRTALPRQRTLAATLDWSYQLLDARAQALLRRMAVFAGGWTLEAAAVVGVGGAIAPSDVLDLLSELVDRSLVLVELESGEAEGRYRMLETIRQYAADRLAEAGETASTRDRHLAWTTEWAETNLPRLVEADQVRWLRRIGLEHDNFRAALEWTRAQGNAAAELRLAAALGRFWHLRGPSSEGRAWLRHALEHRAPEPSLARAQALNWAGRLATVNGEPDDRDLLEQSVAMADELGDAALLALAQRHLGMAARRHGDRPGMRRALEAGLVAARAAGDRREEAFALISLGAAAHQEGAADAADLLGQGLALASDVGDAGPVGWAQLVLGSIAAEQGRQAEATRLSAEALARARPMGYWAVIVGSLAQLSALARAQGDLAAARRYGRECVAAARDAADLGLIAAALTTFAELELSAGDAERATRLLAAESAWRAASGAQRAVSFWTWRAPTPEEARARLGEAAFGTAWAAGRRLTLWQAVEDVLVAQPTVAPS